MSSKTLKWKIGDKKKSEVHFKKLIKDLRDQFPYDSLTAFIVETFANSIDADATRIDIFVGKDVIKILDDGKGMKEDDFLDYHNLASLAKTKGESIGFAGVGAKIYLDKTYYIITETKNKKYHSATKWAFHGDSLQYQKISTQNRVTHQTGTYVEVKIRDNTDIKNLSVDYVKTAIQLHYNAILLGNYGNKRITVNNDLLLPFELDSEDIDQKLYLVTCFLFRSHSKEV